MPVKVQGDNAVYKRNEDGFWLCMHVEGAIQRACCMFQGSSGYIECGCGGRDSVVCYNPFCTGITDDDADILLAGGEIE